jgi:hypothetical protein
MFKKGDKVKVWSLQSFTNGGFLNGEPAIVRQSQNGDSVILCVVRNFGGEYKLDKSYEVYAKQCELIQEAPKSETSYIKASKELDDYLQELMNNNAIN